MYYLRALITISFLSKITAASAQDLTNHRWQDRLIVIIAEDGTHPTFLQQVQELQQDQDALLERRLLIYQVLPQRFKVGVDDAGVWKDSPTLYEQFNTAKAPFQVLLIGLDGGVKLRKQTFTAQDDFFDLIDTMPMRRAEMRRKKN